MTKPNCYECKHRRNVPGDCHSSCAHPANGNETNQLESMVMLMMGRAPKAGNKVVGDPHGIRAGWFMYPMNFDPAWLVSCEGFEEKETK